MQHFRPFVIKSIVARYTRWQLDEMDAIEEKQNTSRPVGTG